jgi:segregation and condensation protein A
MMDFQTEKFQGPLGLLLQMIEAQEMDITEIALANIADQYVRYVEQAGDIDPEEIVDFLLIASRLLYIKSKALLPYLTSDEDEEVFDDLEKQLRMYKEFIEASVKVSDLIKQEQLMLTPVFNKTIRQEKQVEITFAPPTKLKVSDLHEAYLNILAALEKRQEQKLPEERLEIKVNIEDRIGHIRSLLAEQLSISFHKLLEKSQSKVEVIVNILAMLELAKQRELEFEQVDLFSEIKILKI